MNKLSNEKQLLLINTYINELCTKEKLCIKFSISKKQCNQILKNFNIKTIPQRGGRFLRKYTLNEHYFDIIDTEEKAYFLGLLYADGYNYEKSGEVEISLQEKDKYILEKFNKALESTRPLQFIENSLKNAKWKNIYRLCISSKILSNRIKELGCPQRKSLILDFPNKNQVPSFLLRHFIRGYFDGDGTVGIYHLKNNYINVDCSFICNLEFANKFNNFIFNKLNYNFNIYKNKRTCEKPTRTCGLSSRKKILIFLEWLYKDTNLFLMRKYSIFLEMKKI